MSRRLKLNFLYILISIFSCAVLFANQTTDHHNFETKIVVTSNNESAEQNSQTDHKHAQCSEHGHGHCCLHIINNAENGCTLNLSNHLKSIVYSKNIVPFQFMAQCFRPPIV